MGRRKQQPEQQVPDTRARIEARRRMRKRERPAAASAQADQEHTRSVASPARQRVSRKVARRQAQEDAMPMPSAAKAPGTRHVRDRLRASKSSEQQQEQAREQAREQASAPIRVSASFAAASNVLKHTRERARAHRASEQARREERQARPTTSRLGRDSKVRLGPRRLLLHWLATGRMLSMALFMASMGVLIYLFVSPDFQVQQVQVQGNSVLRNEVIVELSALQQTPIWFVNTARSQERLLQNAYIEQASIDVLLPDRAVINVVERQPEVRWQVGNMQYLLDKNGTVLDVADEPADPGTLVIVGTPSAPGQDGSLQPMDHVDPDALELARALALRLPVEIGFTPQIIGWDIALGVYVRTESGQTIVFGRTENLDRKLAIFRHLLNDGTAFTYLDLRPSNPFYRLEG